MCGVVKRLLPGSVCGADTGERERERERERHRAVVRTNMWGVSTYSL